MPARIVVVCLFLCVFLSDNAAAEETHGQRYSTSGPSESEFPLRALEEASASAPLIQPRWLAGAHTAESARDSSTLAGGIEGPLAPVVDRIAALAQGLFAIIQGIGALPAAMAWIADELADPEKRRLWTRTWLHFALSVGLVYLALRGVRRLTSCKRRRLADPSTTRSRARVLRPALLLELLPVLAFAALGLAILAWLGLEARPRSLALIAIGAIGVIALSQGLSRLLFAPDGTQPQAAVSG
jgi:hypothetical protein